MDEMPGRFPPPPETGPPSYDPLAQPPGYGQNARGAFPMDVGRIFQLAWSIFRFAWRSMVGAGLILLGPVYAVMAMLSAIFSPRINEWLVLVSIASRTRTPLPSPPPGTTEAIIALIAAAIVLFLASILLSAALVALADTVFRGGRPSAREAIGTAFGRFVSLIGAQLLLLLIALGIFMVGFVFGAFLLVGGGMGAFLGLVAIVATFAAGLFVSIRLTLLVQAIVLERAGAVEGFGRSWRLVAGSGWRVLGYLVLVGVLAGLLGLALTLPMTLVLGLDSNTPLDIYLGTLVEGFGSIVLAPMVPLIFTLLYYDLRWRKGEPVPGPGETAAAAAPPSPPAWG